MENNTKDSYLSSLKSIETENWLDRQFYRPIGYRLAMALKGTGITPNMVTIASIFVGLGGGLSFVHSEPLWWAFVGIACMVAANIMDCVDGQLARLTGIKSEVGRILDGLAGDIWFACIYICLVVRLSHEHATWLNGKGWILFLAMAILSGFSHLVQAAVTDYYKTIHLFFISPEKGRDFESSDEIRNRLCRMRPGINRVLTSAYLVYTSVQEFFSPHLQSYLRKLLEQYGAAGIPQEQRKAFRSGSQKVMKVLDLLTFNGRSIPLFVFVLLGQVWLYFIYEFVVLNVVLVLSISKHEAMCKKLATAA
ncbi:CDP-alcohol phosphatidyltransferase [Porphyromonas crevioricanis]|uniref:ClpB protein n=1 Tax=Porphyromonas crevioricanis JCM 15906 TaxID=1305617 RepID=T1DRG6_9PORP|nr:CDP-alcohol phosphatidyltransferase family protein [Porphyromonas crevioricanis]KGN90241.1 CDP-alcohol phosphatidyltransferase [Porphyromonas crevioricanis]GAD04854.1 ClpB protein [Porphyromonas crevioricanis JCM 15906]SJZ95334.1 CDP-alcohol phosphatidyltransferase [Porphyromonas crevioricanis]